MSIEKEGGVRIRCTTDGAEQLNVMSSSLTNFGSNIVRVSETFGSHLKREMWSGFTAGIRDAIGYGIKFSDKFGADGTKAVDGMRKASGGLIDSLELLRSKTTLTTGDFKYTEEQLELLSKAAVKYARVNKVEMSEAMRAVTQAASGGEGLQKALQAVGSSAEVTGSKSEKMGAFMAILGDKLGGVSIAATTTAEKMQVTKNSISDASGELASAIRGTSLYKETVEGVSSAITGMAAAIRDSGGAAEKQLVSLRNFTDFMAVAFPNFALGAVKDAREVEKQLEKMAGGKFFDNPFVKNTLGKKPADNNGGYGSFIPMEFHLTGKKTGGAGNNNMRDWNRKAFEALQEEENNPVILLDRFGEAASEATKNAREFQAAAVDLFDEMNAASGQTWEKIKALTSGISAESRDKIKEQRDSDKAQLEERLRAAGIIKQKKTINDLLFDEALAVHNVDLAYQDLAQNGMTMFTEGLLAAVSASILGADTIGAALAKVVGATFTALGQMSGKYAAFELFKGFATMFTNPAESASHFYAAAGFGALAIGLQVAGGAVTGAVGSGGAGNVSGTAIARESGGFRPNTSAIESRDEKRPIIVQVTFDRSDPSADIFANRTLKQRVARG